MARSTADAGGCRSGRSHKVGPCTPPAASSSTRCSQRSSPSAWLTDVLERMVSGRTKANELERLLPWAWKAEQLATAVHA